MKMSKINSRCLLQPRFDIVEKALEYILFLKQSRGCEGMVTLSVACFISLRAVVDTNRLYILKLFAVGYFIVWT